jgi:hypothetical protein
LVTPSFLTLLVMVVLRLLKAAAGVLNLDGDVPVGLKSETYLRLLIAFFVFLLGVILVVPAFELFFLPVLVGLFLFLRLV